MRLLFIFDFLFITILILLGLLFFALSKGKRYQHPEIFLGISIMLLLCGGGVMRVAISEQSQKFSLDPLLSTTVEFNGVVISDIERKENYRRFVVQVENEKILVYTNPLEKVFYGDEVLISGVLQKPEIFYDASTMGKKDVFDWPRYLAKDDIYYEFFYPKITNNGKAELSLAKTLRRALFKTRESFMGNIQKVIKEPEVSLLAGEVIGEKSSLGKDLEESLRRTGIIHVVVLSGYNVTIVAESIARTLSFLPGVVSAYVGIVAIILFALMTGASATVVRASIMAILVILARRYGSLYNVTTALLLAGMLMVMHNPRILLFDPSFQLSFLATVGLIYVSPRIQTYFSFIPKKFGMQEVVSATIGTQIFVLPLLVYMVGNVSLVSLPVNFLVLPVIPLTMFFGFVTGIIGYVSYTASLLVGWVGTLFLSYQLAIVSIFDGKWAGVALGKIPLGFVFLIYTFYLILFVYLKGKDAGRDTL